MNRSADAPQSCARSARSSDGLSMPNALAIASVPLPPCGMGRGDRIARAPAPSARSTARMPTESVKVTLAAAFAPSRSRSSPAAVSDSSPVPAASCRRYEPPIVGYGPGVRRSERITAALGSGRSAAVPFISSRSAAACARSPCSRATRARPPCVAAPSSPYRMRESCASLMKAYITDTKARQRRRFAGARPSHASERRPPRPSACCSSTSSKSSPRTVLKILSSWKGAGGPRSAHTAPATRRTPSAANTSSMPSEAPFPSACCSTSRCAAGICWRRVR
mmetsp:Transcript_45880/g.147755  ORF Transcript_45880/g.147755 Transcript_45880/m.147755 type:complete len:279 (-) Transcript_45880:199-1035(-)